MTIAAITEDEIHTVVHAFYARVREDPMIGPVFNGAIHDWPVHLEKLEAFWSSVMLTSGRYKGQPVPAHVRHEARITPEGFARWLSLWRETTDALLPPPAAAAMQDKAGRIAESLSHAIAFYRDKTGSRAPCPASER
ncbi:group III truncated hemoglobin [Sphingomonas sp. JC676]|uniref:group III truncated hemoglobin n=1 Tax=Sphingomonas sp. JC676 TaxID=2768065 RepID=UPI001658025F|nr:group III truncated hemoglobin [Sphingomonas sp. JC676]MBC9030790.1 group III truncated hemoglobin [Sphingomonas sp. JC676]